MKGFLEIQEIHEKIEGEYELRFYDRFIDDNIE